MIKILTYPDPYTINQIESWPLVRDCPWFCGSQVMANSMMSLYQGSFLPGQVSTVMRLAEALFPKWTDSTASVILNVTVERYIQEFGADGTFDEKQLQVWMANRREAASAISTLIDLKLRPKDVELDPDRPEQAVLMKLYGRLLRDKRFQGYFSEQPTNLEQQIAQGLKAQREPGDYVFQGTKRIVLADIHQFSPLLIRMIRALEQDYDLYFLFNDRKDYSNIYATWERVYRHLPAQIEIAPDSPIHSASTSTRLGSAMGNLFEGQIFPEMFADQIELIEFDNDVSFAHYVSDQFEIAQKKNPKNPLAIMNEKFYSANMNVNQILQVYFPEQFEEKNFLNYPIGQFFLGMAQLWNAEQEELVFTEISGILKLLSTGVVPEEHSGELLSTMERILPYVQHVLTLDELIERLNDLQDRMYDDEEFQIHLEYFQISDEELDRLLKAMNWLKEVSESFFEVFEDGEGNFAEFYKRLDQFIHNVIDDEKYLQKEIVQTLEKVSLNLNKLENLRITGSVETLARTMDLFLTEEESDKNSAGWIVKGFRQLEGDILHSQFDPSDTFYHFACLSDEEILKAQEENLWPLNQKFWKKVSQKNENWGLSLYLASCKERSAYFEFCLFCGLYFNKRKYKLSYVKNRQNQKMYPYYILDLLNCHKNPQAAYANAGFVFNQPVTLPSNFDEPKEYTESDYYNYLLCPYRFQLASNADQTFRYRSIFLIEKYFSLLLSQRVSHEKSKLGDQVLNSEIQSELEDLEAYFPWMYQSEKDDVMKEAKRHRLKKTDRYVTGLQKDGVLVVPGTLTNDQQQELSMADSTQILDVLSPDKEQSRTFYPVPGKKCLYCPVREICLAGFTASKKGQPIKE